MTDEPMKVPTVFIDVTKTALPVYTPPPSWLITRWDRRDADFSTAEREEVAAAGVTDFDDFGCGISYNRKKDADKIAMRLADRFCIAFGVYGPDDKGEDGIWLAPPPQLKRIDL
jgi:hypothetical protein